MSAAQDLAIYFLFMIAAMSALSLPLAPATLLAAKIAPPWAVACVATCSAGLAALFDYAFIRRAFQLKALEKLRRRPLVQRAERLAKVAPFWTTAAFAGFPLPFTIVRILMPLSGYPRRRYVGAVMLGRFPRIFVIAAFGAVLDIPTDVLVGLLAGTLALAAALAVARKLGWIRSWTSAGDEPATPALADESASGEGTS